MFAGAETNADARKHFPLGVAGNSCDGSAIFACGDGSQIYGERSRRVPPPRRDFLPPDPMKSPQPEADLFASVAHLQTLWDGISAFIRTHVSPDTFQRWFSSIDVADADDRAVSLRVPNSIHRIWIESNYLPVLNSAVAAVIGAARKIEFTIQDESADSTAEAVPARGPIAAPRGQPAVAEPASARGNASASGLNPRFTFESFVVGQNTEFAHAASLAVAHRPAVAHNPLFMFGGVGLGKTHLMQAIGHQVVAEKPNKKVLYVTCEQFTNDYINALAQGDALNKFRRRYRAVDVLLLDDVQFLGGKEKTQEEFFHTFNELINSQKQIVLSCDRPPAEIGGLEQRLVSRFEWGMTAEIVKPDMETRLAILRRKAGALSVTVPDHALQFLANRVRANIRRLEGALMRVATHLSLSGGELTVDRLETLLRDILLEEAKRIVSIEEIQRSVADQYDLRVSDMTSKRRPANIAFPRQIAMFLAREMTKASLNEIGDAFGGRDHGTVLHAHKLVTKRLIEDAALRSKVAALRGALER